MTQATTNPSAGSGNPGPQVPVAIVGMGCIFPQACNPREYWDNILKEIDCVTPVPANRWNLADYYDPDPETPDKTYAYRGGFIPDIPFNPIEFGLPPNVLEVTDVSQLLALVVARQALQDAGCLGDAREAQFDREHTGVILGISGGQKIITSLGARLQYPVWERVLRRYGVPAAQLEPVIAAMKSAFVKWEENSFPGLLANVIAGRIANRFDLGGINCVTDAACAASLSAVYMAVNELTSRRHNIMLTGGIDLDNSPFAYMCFSKTPAFSKRNASRPFDQQADGMMVGEGLGMLVLKRLDDAEQAHDRIYAVIKGMGAASDGRFKSIYAPRAEGQAKALRRAYAAAGFAPESLGMLEAHGTGTPAGDPEECKALHQVFPAAAATGPHIALGSVKSQIAHTKAAAGAASLIKTALALYHKILPATLHVAAPNPRLELAGSPFYLSTTTRPWFRALPNTPRRAGVSAFGFGGSNFHVVLEEHSDDPAPAADRACPPAVLLVQAATPAALLDKGAALWAQWRGPVGEQAYAGYLGGEAARPAPQESARLGFVAEGREDACNLLELALETLRASQDKAAWEHARGIYYRRTGFAPPALTVALFPGQGTQFLGMGSEAAISAPPLLQAFAAVDRVLQDQGRPAISAVVYPPPGGDANTQSIQAARLQQTENAQPALAAFSTGMFTLLRQAGWTPDLVAGHSFGELTALWAAGVVSQDDYFKLVHARGQAMAAPVDPACDAGAMLAVQGRVTDCAAMLQAHPGLTVANWNAPDQVILAGSTEAITQAQATWNQPDLTVTRLRVSAAFHSAFVRHAQRPFAAALEPVVFQPPQIPVYSNTTAQAHPADPRAIKSIMAEHIVKPVQFQQEIEAMYAAGGRIFVDLGPRPVLANLVARILADRPHQVIALNRPPPRPMERGPTARKCQVQREPDEPLTLALENLTPWGVGLMDSPAAWTPGTTLRVRLLTPGAPEDGWVAGRMVWRQGAAANVKFMPDAGQREWLAGIAVTATDQPAPPPRRPYHGLAEALAQLRVAGLDLPPPPARERLPAAAAKPALNIILTGTTYVSPQTIAAREEAYRNLPMLADDAPRTLAAGMELNQGGAPGVAAVVPDGMSMPAFEEGESMETHQQYLRIIGEGVQCYRQLLQQQAALLANPHCTPAMMESFERSLARFHDDQTQLHQNHAQFLARLGGGAVAGAPPAARAPLMPPPPAVAPLAAPAPVPTTIPPPPASVPAKPAAVVPPPAPSVVAAPPPPPTPPAPAGDQGASGTQALLAVVSEKTGYPIDTLNLDMALETDLGIDSIKRVQILGAMQERFPSLPPFKPDVMATLTTLRQIGDYIEEQLAAGKKKELTAP